MRAQPDSDSPSVTTALLLLFGRLSARRRLQLVPVLLLALVGAIAELLTLGALLPFLATVADPQGSPILAPIRPVLTGFGFETPLQQLYALTGVFAAAALISAVLRLAILWATQRYVFGFGRELGVRIYANVLAQPYSYHTQRNSSETIAAISKAQILTVELLQPLIQAVVATVLAAAIIIGLMIVDPVVAMVSGVAFTSVYLTTSLFTRSRLRRNSATIARAQSTRVRAMQEGLGGIRDVLLDRSQAVFVEVFGQAESALRDARARNSLFAHAPRYLVEGAGMVIIALVAVSIVGRLDNLSSAIPVLGVLALGAQRLLPLVQQIYWGWANLMGGRQSLLDVLELVSQPVPAPVPPGPPLRFDRSIVLQGVGYAYREGLPPVLSGISLEIVKGARVGIVGKTGSGKSTLMDLLIGLLEPTEGEILVDGVPLNGANRAAWQRNVAHVPQAIFLADASIAENIAFGVPPAEIDHERVRRAAGQAELAEVIAQLPEGYDTRVGERGIQLSGGQRQRIGIARALYKRADVLIFDEATSALDTETERAVMEAIGRLDRKLTIILIAHRLSTLDGCDMMVRLEGGAWIGPRNKNVR